MRDTIPGSIYVEALTLDDVRAALVGISGVRRTRDHAPCMELVPTEDRVALLNMSDTTAIGEGTWVRIKRMGLYHNDLAFVLEFNKNLMEARVAVVPRIRLASKRQRRPQPLLFDIEMVKVFYGEGSIERRNQIHVFRKQEFKHCLLELDLACIDLSDRNIAPTHSELLPFSKCGNPCIVNAAMNEMVRLRLHDRIKVTAGELQGTEGHVAFIDQQDIVTVNPVAALDPQPVSGSDVRKDFQLGDFVEVISGERQGAEGWIVSIDETQVSLYCRLAGELYGRGEGDEVG
jgi:transcription elongation factor